jgi:hypothetical protein
MLSKDEIAKRFGDRGLNQSTLFRWINQRAMELATGIVVERAKPKPVAEVVREHVNRGERALALIPPPNPGGGISFMEIIQANLDELRAGLAMAELPHRRDQILAAMEALRLRYGSAAA